MADLKGLSAEPHDKTLGERLYEALFTPFGLAVGWLAMRDTLKDRYERAANSFIAEIDGEAATIIERLDRETLKAAIRPVLDRLTEPGTRSLDGMTGDLADAIISHLQGETS